MSIRCGLRAGVETGAVAYVSSDPDGTLTAPRGTLAIDTTTGVWWRNEDGGTTWWPETIPIRSGGRFFADFVANSTGGTATFGVVTATAGGASNPVASTSGRAGIVQYTVAAVADALDMRTSGFVGILLGGGKYYCEAAVAHVTAEDGTNRFSTRVGLGDANAADHVDGVYFESSLAANGSANWFRCTASNSVRTKTDTGIAPSAGVYQRLRFLVNASASQVDYWIDDVSVGSNTTNIPTGAGRDCGPHLQMIKTLGATSRAFNVDYYDLAYVFSTRR